MTVSATDIVLKYVFPGLGVVLANIMFMAPVKDCYEAVKVGKGLGPLNPIPWAFTLGNCFGVRDMFTLLNFFINLLTHVMMFLLLVATNFSGWHMLF
jgi:hypothetical protein